MQPQVGPVAYSHKMEYDKWKKPIVSAATPTEGCQTEYPEQKSGLKNDRKRNIRKDSNSISDHNTYNHNENSNNKHVIYNNCKFQAWVMITDTSMGTWLPSAMGKRCLRVTSSIEGTACPAYALGFRFRFTATNLGLTA